MIITFSSGEKKVDVDINDLNDLIENYIDNVKNTFGYENIRLIYKGMEMDHKKPFSKYNIKENDVILCAAKKPILQAATSSTSTRLTERVVTESIPRQNTGNTETMSLAELMNRQPNSGLSPVNEQSLLQNPSQLSLEQEITRMITQLTQRISGQSTADVRVTALSYGPQTSFSQLFQSLNTGNISNTSISATATARAQTQAPPPPERQNIWATPVDPQTTGLYNLEQIHATFISAFPSIIFDPNNPEFRQDPVSNLQTERVRSILLSHLQNSNNFLNDLRQGNFGSAYPSRPANSQNQEHQENEDEDEEESGNGTEEEEDENEENEVGNEVGNEVENAVDSDEEELLLTEEDHEKIRRLVECTGADIERATREYLASHKNLDRAANNLIN